MLDHISIRVSDYECSKRIFEHDAPPDTNTHTTIPPAIDVLQLRSAPCNVSVSSPGKPPYMTPPHARCITELQLYFPRLPESSSSSGMSSLHVPSRFGISVINTSSCEQES